MQTVLILTVSGKDQAGLVESLAEVIAEHQGNWEHCRMARLANRFAGILQVSVPAVEQQELETALRSIPDLDVMVAPGNGGLEESAPPPSRPFELQIVGCDHPGIVRDIFAALAEAGANIEELNTSLRNAPESGEVLFEAWAAGSSENTDNEVIRERLESIAADLMVDARFVEGRTHQP
ncbi:MAG: glycine cleavage system protein R [Opitutales bacterium]